MSFWRTFGFHTVSAVETILDKESFTLEELLDEEEILQEVKSQNKKLLDFLTLPPTLLKLFEYITIEAPEDADPKRRFKYPFLACEILCSEIWTITESIYRDESLLDVLFAFLDQPPPLSPLLASYTSRVAQAMLSRRTSEVFSTLLQRHIHLYHTKRVSSIIDSSPRFTISCHSHTIFLDTGVRQEEARHHC
jgi:hypothetical protein